MLLIWMGWRYRQLRILIGELAEAAQDGRIYLIDQRIGIGRHLRIQDLVEALNRLITDNARILQAGQGYFDQIQTTLGNLREAVVMVDGEQHIMMANPAFHELAGKSTEPVGEYLYNLLQGKDFFEFLMGIRRDAQPQRKEIEVAIQDKRRWLDISVAPLPENPRSKGVFTLFVFHDVTRQKGLEKMRTEFVANASHELKTPVTIIKGFAETLVEDDSELSPEDRLRFLKKITTNADRLHRLLQDLLLLSRLESADAVLNRERQSLSALIRDTVENWRVCLEEGRQILYDFAEGEDVAMVDPLRFSQVLTNLLDNIRRHAKGFNTITLRTRVELGGVRMYVEDDGAGIPEKDLPHIFQRFYRVDKGRSRESGGTGLGLSIVKHIVQEHGGEIRASSQRNRGTSIEIFLPNVKVGGKPVLR